MFSKALIATDLSLASHHVVCSAASLDRLGLKEAVLLFCFIDVLSDETMLAYKVIESARPMFTGQKKALEEKGFSVTGEMVVCRSYQEINRQAERNDCSLVVVGSSGKKMSSFGGVVNAVLHNLTRPTLVLRVRFQEEEGEVVCKDCAFDPLKHVLFPTDFSDNAERAFAYVQKIADSRAERVTLMHVQNQARIEKASREQLAEMNRIGRLERLKTDLEGRGIGTVDIELPYGLPKREIVEYTRQNDVSLVVMGSQGRGFVKEFFLGSVSHSVARYAASSVLVIPPLG